MAPDNHANFAYSTVLTAPSPATSGTSVVVQSGDGSLFPTSPSNAVICPAGVAPLASNAEIVRVTAISTDTFTITRAQEGTTARTVLVGDQIFAAVTKKTLTDIEAAPVSTFTAPSWSAPSTVAPTANLLYYHGIVIPGACTLTGLRFTCSSAAGNAIVALYNASGTRLAVSSSTVVGGLSVNSVAFTGTYAAVQGLYFAAAIFSSASATISTAASTLASGSAAQGGFSTPSTITAPTVPSIVPVAFLTTY